MLRFRKSLIDGAGATATRKTILAEAIKSLPADIERAFFHELLKPRFPANSLASTYERRAKTIEAHLRDAAIAMTGPLCLVVLRTAAEAMQRPLSARSAAPSWADWLLSRPSRLQVSFSRQRHARLCLSPAAQLSNHRSPSRYRYGYRNDRETRSP